MIGPTQPPDYPAWLRCPVRPNIRWLTDAQEQIANSTAVTARAPDAAVFGLAFEYAVALDLAQHMPYPHMLAALPEAEAQWVAWRAGFAPPDEDPDAAYRDWCHHQPTPPAWLHAAASHLAQHCHLLYRVGDGSARDSRAFWTDRSRFVVALRNTAEQASTFRQFWQTHTASPRQILQNLGPVHAADVPFHQGRYFADLIIGTSVVEVKTGVMGTDEDLLKTLRQTVRYALLAQHHGYEITNTVAYLARYATLVQTPLQTAADDLAGGPVDLAQARAALAVIGPFTKPNPRGNPEHR